MPYLTGNDITVADLGLYPIYAGRKALIDGASLRNVTAWGERVGARPGVQKGMKLES
jgi:glutathione S-transferase